MKKVTMAVTAAGLIAAVAFSFFLARNAGWALSGVNEHPTTRTYTIEKNGVTKTVEARKELLHISGERPPDYDPSDREWVGEPQIWAQLKQVTREALQAQRDATLYVNRGRSAVSKENLANYYSADSGQLQLAQHEIDMTFAAPDDTGWSERTITKMDFKGISVQDNKATVVVDIWIHVADKDFKANRDLNSFENAEQHTVTLEMKNNKWMITKDLWVFLPGYGP